MKQKDIAVIIAVVALSSIVAYVVANSLFGSPQKRQLKTPVVNAINTDFNRPDTRYFNNQSLNPTKQIRIGDNLNTEPFKNTTP